MKTEWDLGGLKSDFEKERVLIEKINDNFKNKWEKDSTYLENPLKLKEALDEIEKISEKFSKGGNEFDYYFLNQELNQNDAEIRRKFLSADEFIKKQSNKIIFFSINLSKIGEERKKEFLQNPILKKYHPYLFELFENAKHILSEKEEKILTLKENASYGMWVRMVSSLLSKETRISIDEKGEKKEFVYSELMNLMKSADKKVRLSAKKAFEDILKKYEEIAEFEINAVLEEAKINDELRGFTRADEARIKSDSIDFDFVNSVLEAVKEKFSISREYYKLKATLMGQKKIGYSERTAELKKVEKIFDLDSAVEIIKKVFSKLDKNFTYIFEDMLKSGKIDFFPKIGKNGGAFCVSFGKNKPVYVLLNYTNKLRDVAVISHEMGHAINYKLMKKEPSIYYDLPKSTGEVASTFMEDFIYKEIMEELSEEDRFFLKIARFEDDLATIPRQIALYFFELEIHESYRKEGYLSKEKIGKIFVKHMSEYLGKSVDMKNANLWWVYWEHIRLFFYVYSYASGLLISKAMQKKYRRDKNFIEKIKLFLSTGTSKRPREIFKELGMVK